MCGPDSLGCLFSSVVCNLLKRDPEQGLSSTLEGCVGREQGEVETGVLRSQTTAPWCMHGMANTKMMLPLIKPEGRWLNHTILSQNVFASLRPTLTCGHPAIPPSAVLTALLSALGRVVSLPPSC